MGARAFVRLPMPSIIMDRRVKPGDDGAGDMTPSGASKNFNDFNGQKARKL
jgi:hypothetical protein